MPGRARGEGLEDDVSREGQVIAQRLDGRLGVSRQRRLHDDLVFSLDVPRLHAVGEEAIAVGLR